MKDNATNTQQSVALVTGANRGLGYGTSLELAKLGHAVIMVGRHSESLEKASNRLRAEAEASAKQELAPIETFCANVTDAQQVQALAQFIEKRFGHLDILVNNAGVILEGHVETDRSATMKNVSPEIVRETFEINTLGPYRLFQELRPLLEKSPLAKVVNVSSGMAQLTGMEGGFPAYRISKTALNALTCIIHAEAGGAALKVNAVCPGWVRTDMGGQGATRSVEEGARGIVWAATLDADGPSGGLFRDGQSIDW